MTISTAAGKAPPVFSPQNTACASVHGSAVGASQPDRCQPLQTRRHCTADGQDGTITSFKHDSDAASRTMGSNLRAEVIVKTQRDHHAHRTYKYQQINPLKHSQIFSSSHTRDLQDSATHLTHQQRGLSLTSATSRCTPHWSASPSWATSFLTWSRPAPLATTSSRGSPPASTSRASPRSKSPTPT